MAGGVSLRVRDEGTAGAADLDIAVDALVIAGWTGRDAAAVEAHIHELETLGVPRPSTVPIFYRVAAALLTTADAIQVAGPDSSGEVEVVLFGAEDGMRLGAASDHTDRRVESQSITVAKQMCAKPVAPAVWRFEDVRGHWDDLVLRAWAVDGGARRLYQEGPVTALRDPLELIARYLDGAGSLPPGTAMLGGTLPAIDGVMPAERFEFELADPVLGRSIRHGYDVRVLPIVT